MNTEILKAIHSSTKEIRCELAQLQDRLAFLDNEFRKNIVSFEKRQYEFCRLLERAAEIGLK